MLAVEAGADILLMPQDAEATVQAVCDAVKSGRISPARIRASVERIWQAKGKVFGQQYKENSAASLHRQPLVPSPLYQISTPSAHDIVSQILQDSTEVIGHPSVGIKNLINSRNLIIVDDVLDCKFLNQQSPAIAIPQELGYSCQICDSRIPVLSHGDALQPTLLQLIRGNHFREVPDFRK